MFDWMLNFVNWLKLLVAALVVVLNYALGWGLDTAAIAGIGASLAIPVELWGFIAGLIAKLFGKSE